MSEPLNNPGVVAKIKTPRPLNVQQDLFCREYVVDFNASGASVRAGYSATSGPQYSTELLKMPAVRARIAELLQERRAEYEISEERIKREVARLAFSDITELIDLFASGKNQIMVKSLQDVPKRHRAAIKSFKNTKFGIEVTFHDKQASLDMLAKFMGMYRKDNEQKKAQTVFVYLPDNGRGDRIVDAPQAQVIEPLTEYTDETEPPDVAPFE